MSHVIAAGAGDLRKAAAPYSLPLSSTSGAGGSICLPCAWVLQYTPYSVNGGGGKPPPYGVSLGVRFNL